MLLTLRVVRQSTATHLSLLEHSWALLSTTSLGLGPTASPTIWPRPCAGEQPGSSARPSSSQISCVQLFPLGDRLYLSLPLSGNPLRCWRLHVYRRCSSLTDVWGFSNVPSGVVLTTTILGLFSRLLEESKSGKQALREVCPLIAGSTSRRTITHDSHRSSGPWRSACSACFWSRECGLPSAPLFGPQVELLV